MTYLRFWLGVCLRGFVYLVFAALTANVSQGQVESRANESVNETEQEQAERVRAERFLEVLKQRPRLGTALDRVYGYHVGRGSLDTFCESLEEEAKSDDSGSVWLILGMVQLQRGQDALAAIAFENAEQRLPDEALASYYLGKSLLMLGEVDKAADAMRRAIERKPARADMLAIFQDLGAIYQRTGRNQEALEVWNQLEALFPGDRQVQEEIADVLATEGALEAALARYTSLSTNLTDSFRRVEMSIRAAQLKVQLGKTDEALADFERQLAVVNPDSWLHRDVRRRIEEVFWSSGDIDGLVAYYSKWIDDHPDDVDAMMRTARVLSLQRRTPEAEKWFRDAIAKAPSRTEPRRALVEALVTDGRYDQAAQEMEELVKLEPDNPDYLVRQGELVFNDTNRTEEERKAESDRIWRGLLRKRSDDPVTVARVADLLRGIDSREAAISHYRQAIELAPNEPQYREYLGEYLYQIGRQEEALATWRELAAGERETRDNLVRLSEVLSTFRYADEALEAIARACDLKPTFGHRARYAELLREADKYDEALAQLDLAEPLAEDPELREIVLDERIKIYQASGTLAERIEQANADVDDDRATDPDAWRLLALLRDADRQFQLACEAIDKATELDAGNSSIWETAAKLQERGGRFGDAISSYRKLVTIDRRYLSNYLTQIASLEMRLGNAEDALKAGEELIASAPGNSEHYRFFADLCFRLGQTERGFEVLRRNVRGNPNDADALRHLAQLLAEEFHTDEAIELYWRAFDLANDVEGKTAVITPLAELYLRTNRFETLLDRLEMTGREQNKPRDGLLWAAAAHQAAGDLGMARQMLEQLAREDSRDTKLLEQLVSLSRTEYDFESAAEFQRRLVAAAPSPEGEFLLANILLELGEIDQAESLWLKLSQRKNDPSALTNSISTLLQKEQFDTAAALIDKAIATHPGDWEILTQAMIVYSRLDRKAEARQIGDRVLAMNIDPGEPSASVKAQIEKRSSRRNPAQNQYDPYEHLGLPSGLMQAALQIKATLVPGSTDRYFGRSQGAFVPNCFRDAQAVAYCMSLVAREDDVKEADFINKFTRQALETGDPAQLWQAVFYLAWANPRVQYGDATDETFEKCLKALVEKQDPFAASTLISLMMNGRQRRGNGNLSSIDPLTTEEIDQLKALSELAQSASQREFSYYNVLVAGELSRAGQSEEAEKLLDQYIDSAKQSSNSHVAIRQAMSVLMNDIYIQDLSPRLILKGRELFRTALEGLQPSSTSASGYGQVFAAFAERLVKHGQLEEALSSLHDLLRWQAEQTADMRPSQRDRLQASGGPIVYGRVVNGNYVQTTIAFPPASGYFSVEAIHMLHGLHEACKDDKEKLAAASAQIDSWADEPSDDPYQRLAHIVAKAAFAYWKGDRNAAEDTLATANQLQLGGQFIELARTRLLYESGKIRDALAVVEQLRPTNQQMLVDRELTILQLVLQLGDLERARQSSQKLFALRLDADTEFKLADLMYQLGMRDLGDRMMGRIRRRAGGKQDTLVQLMTRYAETNDKAAAAEIARQVIRRTSPRGSQNYYTSENQQHEQAVRILAQTEQLEPLIEQYEKLVERSPKSTKLTDNLAAFYEAAGRRDDAQNLRLRAVENAPNDPRSLLAAGMQLAKSRKHDEAADKFIAAIVASPELLNRSFYEMQSTFDAAKAWGRLTDAIVEEGISKFSQSYQLNEISSALARQGDHEAVNRLLLAGLSEMQWPELTQMLASFSRAEFKVDEKVVKLLGDKLTADDASFAGINQNAYVWSRSTNGRTTSFANGIANIVASDSGLRERVITAMKRRLERNNEELFPRVLLGLVLAEAKDIDGVREAIQPLTAKENKTADDAQAIWCLASALTHDAEQPDVACDLLESVTDDSLWPESGSSFRFMPKSLLAYSYEKAKRKADARRILVQVMMSEKVDEQQNQFNPGYGEYQYISSLSELVDQFLKLGYPAEAFLAYRKAFGDESMLDKAGRWGGDFASQREALSKRIAEKTDERTILSILAAATSAVDGVEPRPEGAADDSADVAGFLTEPQINQSSLIDARVTMPLEEFTSKITEDEQLSQAVSTWLQEAPLDAARSSPPLKCLVTRLLISDAVQNADELASTATAITRWMRANPPSTTSDQSADAVPEESDLASDGTATTTTKSKPLHEELLLGMAALRMPESMEAEEIVPMLERAIAVALANREEALARSLQCQIAKRVASRDPERARAILVEALDSVLPRTNNNGGDNNNNAD